VAPGRTQRSSPAAQSSRAASRRAFTLIEVCIVIAVLAILLSVAMPMLTAGEVEQLRGVGDLLASDLRLAQSLAIRDADSYTLTLVPSGWTVEFTGSGTAPPLPSPVLGGTGTGYQIRTDLFVNRTIAIVGRTAQTNAAVSSVTFTATGRTAASEDTRLWLTVGTGDDARSIPLTVAAATGLVTAGDVVAGAP
jgi:prepilin-type N-terminal cleavage/methylation domain-containing protein